jgi:3-oxoacyl-[acyl-carrier protein] reductase
MPTQTSAWADLVGKVVLVTGGSRGLGRGIVRALSANGAKLLVVGRDLDGANDAASEATASHGVEATAVSADVGSPSDCIRVVETALERFGALDGVLNNAAFFALKSLIEASPEDAARMFDTNTKGPLFLSQAFARSVFERGARGAIVNVSSIAGARPAPGCGLYSASKAALDSLTKTMALEWTPRGVRVNGVAPGHIETEGVLEDFAAGRLDRDRMLAAIPARRIAAPADVAEAVLFLLSDHARHIAGATLTVDGGESM